MSRGRNENHSILKPTLQFECCLRGFGNLIPNYTRLHCPPTTIATTFVDNLRMSTCSSIRVALRVLQDPKWLDLSSLEQPKDLIDASQCFEEFLRILIHLNAPAEAEDGRPNVPYSKEEVIALDMVLKEIYSYRFISSLLNLRKSIRAFAALHPQSSSEKATITVVDTALHLIVASILPSNTRTPKVAEDEELGQGFVCLPDAVDEWIDLLSYGTDAVVADNIIIIFYIIHILDENIDISRKPRLNAFAFYIHSSACQQLSPLVLSLLLALIAYLHPSSSIIPPPTLIHHLSSILLSSSRDSEVTTAQLVLLRSFHLFFPLFPTSKEEQTKDTCANGYYLDRGRIRSGMGTYVIPNGGFDRHWSAGERGKGS
ncbi:hypothetical protein BT69DRAFT_481725 [Atractiella rhizophila]|nr:hypothetical protein BT69DRAFT_481725 [Atractiella rhizophila]